MARESSDQSQHNSLLIHHMQERSWRSFPCDTRQLLLLLNKQKQRRKKAKEEGDEEDEDQSLC